MSDDTIYRQAAIKAIEDLPNCYNGFSDTYDKSCIIGVLEELPSAQPEPTTHGSISAKTVQKQCNRTIDDCISRQAAIETLTVGAELLRRVLDDTDIVGAERAKYEWGLELIESYISDMKELPSAQAKLDENDMPEQGDSAKFGVKTGETCTDCISRQAAIDFIDAGHLCNPNEPRWSDNEVVNFLKSRPSAQPEITEQQVKEYCAKRCLVVLDSSLFHRLKSAQPERKKGTWMTEYLDGIPGRRAEIKYCSECCQVTPYKYKFCPNCGADMRGEQDG